MWNENTHKGWDGKTNLERFLESTVSYCDSLVMYDDESFDNSTDLVMSYDGLFEDLELIRGTKNDFQSELAHKQMALEKCRKIGATHVLWLDVDEVIEARGEMGAMRALCDNMSRGAVNFFQKNLWRTDRYIRTDGLWDQGLFCRLWAMHDGLHYNPTPGLHQDLAPKGIIGRDTTTLKVIHHGFASSDNVLRKYYLYKNHGQNGNALNRLIDESTMRVKESSESWFEESGWPFGPDKSVFKRPLVEML
jgi:hypothetical protein